MRGDTAATEELRNIVGEVVAIVLEEVVGFVTIDGLEGVEIFEEDLFWQRSDTEGDHFHGSAVVGLTGDGELDSLSCGPVSELFSRHVVCDT